MSLLERMGRGDGARQIQRMEENRQENVEEKKFSAPDNDVPTVPKEQEPHIEEKSEMSSLGRLREREKDEAQSERESTNQRQPEQGEAVFQRQREQTDRNRLRSNSQRQESSSSRNEEYIKIAEGTHKEVAAILSKRENVDEKEIEQLISEVMDESNPDLKRVDKSRIAREVLNEITGLGPLQDLINDEEISEIMVNGPNQIYVEKKGKLTKTDVTFQNEGHVRRIIDRIVSPLGRRIDDSNPMVDARLADGSRVNAIIPPVALCGSTVTIRKFSHTPLTIENLINFGSLSTDMAEFLEAGVHGKLNILVSGGTGSGKTTLLNVLSAYIPADERIVTIEDAAELKLLQDHVVSLESRPANLEGKGAITIRDLVRNALRMRPDRIVVGEVRGGETVDMLQAMNTGHDGSLTTAHANSPRDALLRIETMFMMAGMEIPVSAIRQQIAGALDIIIQQARLRDGSRKIISISEVTGMEGDVITIQEIFKYKNEGYDEEHKSIGEFVSTGVKPKCCDKMVANGVKLKDEWFFEQDTRFF